MKRLRSGTLAQRAGVNVETLRYYEREGLLPEPDRTESGYRLYPEEDIRRVRFIKRAQGLGFSLKEIRELLALKLDPTGPASEVWKLAEQKIQAIDEKLRSLQAMRATLVHLTTACAGTGDAEHCPILKSLDNTADE